MEAGSLPTTAADLKPGQRLACFVRGVTDVGVFVGTIHGLSALADRKHLASRFVRDPTSLFAKGQTVFAEVIKVLLRLSDI